MSRWAKLAFPLVLAVFVALTLACGGDDDDDGGDQSGSTTPVAFTASPTPMPTTPIDPATGLPITFPAEFPVYHPSSVTRASDFTDRFVIQWQSDDTPDAVVSFYEDGLATDPWSTDEKTIEGAATRFLFTGTDYSGELAIAQNPQEQTIVLLNLIVE